MAQKGCNRNLHSKLHPVFGNTVAIFRHQNNNGEHLLNTYCAMFGTYVTSFNPHKNRRGGYCCTIF